MLCADARANYSLIFVVLVGEVPAGVPGGSSSRASFITSSIVLDRLDLLDRQKRSAFIQLDP